MIPVAILFLCDVGVRTAAGRTLTRLQGCIQSGFRTTVKNIDIEVTEFGASMYTFTRQARDNVIAKSRTIAKSFWLGALAVIVVLAGLVAKINPGKPMGSGGASGAFGNGSSLNGGYNITSATLAPPPSNLSGPSPSGVGSQGSPSQGGGPPPSVTGAS